MVAHAQRVDRAELRSAHEAFSKSVGDPGVASAAIAEIFDGLTAELRVALVRSLGRAEQRTLYRKVDGFAPVALSDLVPSGRADLEEVRHLGLNTLPVFRVFEKRFCRLPGDEAGAPVALAGYNFQALSPVTGPGYFVAVEDIARREVLVDYRRLPETKPSDWPEIRSNERGLARFVYGFMVDRLRRVSEHVTIGSATRKGREMGSYFALTRSE
ncbi:MAG: hypothetical protein GY910_12435 [bacterium]|nr:hypothetical protein [Deltaproteobacteria bacterium]MCP4905778.1 hypothetical protein [bacterium]